MTARPIIGPAVSIGDAGEITVDAGLVAPRLGLTADAFMRALRSGLIFQVSERGEGADAGRTRVTFRYRARETRVVFDAGGAVLSEG